MWSMSQSSGLRSTLNSPSVSVELNRSLTIRGIQLYRPRVWVRRAIAMRRPQVCYLYCTAYWLQRALSLRLKKVLQRRNIRDLVGNKAAYHVQDGDDLSLCYSLSPVRMLSSTCLSLLFKTDVVAAGRLDCQLGLDSRRVRALSLHAAR